MKQIIRRVAALVIGLGLGAVALAGLESVTHISDLNASWPLGSDLASTSDDHIRNIKTALKTDFPNITGPVTVTQAQLNGITNASNLSSGTVADARLSANVPLLNAANTFTAAQTANSFIPTSSTVPANGLYLPAANTLGFASNSTKWGSVNSAGNWVLVTPSSGVSLAVTGINANDAATFSATHIGDSVGLASGGNVYTTNVSLNVGTSGANALNLYTNATSRIAISSVGAVTVSAPSSGTALSMAPGSDTAAIVITGAAGQRGGVDLIGNNSGAAFSLFQDSSTGAARLFNRANAALDLSTNSSSRVSIAAGGNVTVNAPSSGTTLALSSVSGTGTALTMDGVDATAATGTFTATMTGGATSPTCTARWTRIGNLVMLEICVANATSNATSFTYTGLPSAVQPAVTQHLPAAAGSYENNNTTLPNGVEVVMTASSGTITFWLSGSASGWTSVGIKGITSINTVSYLLN